MIIDRIREDMSVISADDRCIGFVNKILGEKLTITSVTEGYGYDHLIPLSWVSEVDKYVYLDKTSGFVAANWDQAEQRATRTSAVGVGRGRLSVSPGAAAQSQAA